MALRPGLATGLPLSEELGPEPRQKKSYKQGFDEANSALAFKVCRTNSQWSRNRQKGGHIRYWRL